MSEEMYYPRAEQPVGIEKQLLSNAIRLFQELGYENVTVQMICDTCHVTKGSFYYHYRYKESLLMEYYRIMCSGELTQVVMAMLSDADAFDRLWRLFRYYIEGSVKLGKDLLHSLLKINLDHDGLIFPIKREKILSRDPEFIRVYLEVMRDGQENGSIREGDPAQMMEYYMCGLVGALSGWCTGGDDPEKMLRWTFEQLYRPVGKENKR